MDQTKKAEYISILGSPAMPVVISLTLPRLGEHEFKFVDGTETVGKKYFHYGYRLHPEGRPVNVHVYGERTLIEYLAGTGKPATCELELVVKKVSSDREFIFVNLYLTVPQRHVSHEFTIVNTSPNPAKRPPFVYTTKDMGGVGISVES